MTHFEPHSIMTKLTTFDQHSKVIGERQEWGGRGILERPREANGDSEGLGGKLKDRWVRASQEPAC